MEDLEDPLVEGLSLFFRDQYHQLGSSTLSVEDVIQNTTNGVQLLLGVPNE